jgi:hypothetical protein
MATGKSDESVTQRALGALDADTADVLRGFLAEPLMSADLLSEQARVYFKQVEAIANDGEVIDLELVADAAVRCERLLAEVDDDMPEEERRLIQAAVRYFVNEEDADADLESLIGFDDDGAVVEAVAIALDMQHVLDTASG